MLTNVPGALVNDTKKTFKHLLYFTKIDYTTFNMILLYQVSLTIE
jgi:hypothetical protein